VGRRRCAAASDLLFLVSGGDESLLGGSFIEKVRQHWWPEYSWSKFFWFNVGYFAIMIAIVLAYDFMRGKWVVLPLAWVIERACNGFWHVWWSIHFREYSPGLLTSILFWMDLYFVLRYRSPSEPLESSVFLPALAIGLVATAFLSLYIPVVEGRRKRTS
jgi:hypothetical protein